MIARIQQFSTLMLIGLAAGWAGLFVHWGSYPTAAAGALLVLFGYAIFLGLEFLMLVRFGGDDAVTKPAVSQVLQAWGGEVLRTPLVFCWRQPFRSHAEPNSIAPTASGQRGVVFVHGFVCNRGLWNPWMRMLRQRGVPFVAVDLEPPFGSIDGYAGIVEAAVKQIDSSTGQAPVVVAHSMGGLAVRVWLANFDGADRIHRVVTIASPHHGTWLGRFAVTLNGHQMGRRSGWLEALAAREDAGDRARFVCYYGHCDNIVFPASTAMLPGADNRHLAATAHVQMAYHADVMQGVLELIGLA